MRPFAARLPLALSLLLRWPCCAYTLLLEREAGRHSVVRGPIVTGCLEQCGFGDQSCVTQCQVCVEQNKCVHLLQNCSTCLVETHEAIRELIQGGDELRDSGGAPLKHEAIRQNLLVEQRRAADDARRLRKLRNQILIAQRQVEWAIEERREAAGRLQLEEKKLEAQEQEARDWSARSNERLEQMARHVEALRAHMKQTEEQVHILEHRLAEERQRVKEETDVSDRGDLVHEVTLTERVLERLKAKLRTESHNVAEEEQKLYKELQDARWFHAGLRKEVNEVAAGVHRELSKLQQARHAEEEFERHLVLSKDSYRQASQEYMDLRRGVQNLEKDLEANAMPSFLPKALERDTESVGESGSGEGGGPSKLGAS